MRLLWSAFLGLFAGCWWCGHDFRCCPPDQSWWCRRCGRGMK